MIDRTTHPDLFEKIAFDAFGDRVAAAHVPEVADRVLAVISAWVDRADPSTLPSRFLLDAAYAELEQEAGVPTATPATVVWPRYPALDFGRVLAIAIGGVARAALRVPRPAPPGLSSRISDALSNVEEIAANVPVPAFDALVDLLVDITREAYSVDDARRTEHERDRTVTAEKGLPPTEAFDRIRARLLPHTNLDVTADSIAGQILTDLREIWPGVDDPEAPLGSWRNEVRPILGQYTLMPTDVALDRLIDALGRVTARHVSSQTEPVTRKFAQLAEDRDTLRLQLEAVQHDNERLREENEEARAAADLDAGPSSPVDRDEILRVLIEAYLDVVEGDGIGAFDVARSGADRLLSEFDLRRNPWAGADRRRCRVCRCTEGYCGQCIRRTGQPCRWVEDDLCSACLPDETAVRAAGPVTVGRPALSGPPPEPAGYTIPVADDVPPF